MKKIHTTMRGKPIDMDAIRTKNGAMKAIGSGNLNANGDIIDSRGNILKKRQDIVREFHRTSTTVKTANIASPNMNLVGVTPNNGVVPQKSNIDPNFYRRNTINDFEGVTFKTPEEVIAEAKQLAAAEKLNSQQTITPDNIDDVVTEDAVKPKSKKLVEK